MQQGKTTVATIILLHYALFNKAKKIALLANKGDAAREILDRIQLAFENLPKWMQSGVLVWNKGSVEFENGSSILAASSSSSSIRGKSMSFVYIDETAFVENWAEFSASVLPVLSSGETTKLLLTSTPRGLNHYYDLWRRATDGEADEAGNIVKNGYVPIYAPWYKVPNRGNKWKEEILKTIDYDYDKFRQEYEGEFLGSSFTLLNSTTLRSLIPGTPKHSNEFLKQYELPQKGRIYFTVCDVSRGKGLDYSAFSIIDATEAPYRQVCTYRNNKITPTDYATVIYQMSTFYNEAYTLIETNDLGDQVATILKFDYGYDNLLCTEGTGRAGKRLSSGFGKNVENGIKTTEPVKRLGCAVLKLLLEQRQLILADLDTIKEFGVFSKSANSYKAEAGFHDDLVMGLVLFAFISQDSYFRELTDSNILACLRDYSEEEIFEDLVPFGVMSTASEPTQNLVKLEGERGLWEETTVEGNFRF